MKIIDDRDEGFAIEFGPLKAKTWFLHKGELFVKLEGGMPNSHRGSALSYKEETVRVIRTNTKVRPVNVAVHIVSNLLPEDING